MILGLGNILLKDEGAGVWVAREIEKKDLPENVEVIDGGTSSLDVLPSLKDADRLIIIDALKGGGRPGTVYRFSPSGEGFSNHYVSLHQIGLLDALAIAERMGIALKKVIIIGIEPKEMGWGLGVSPDIEQGFPGIVDMILEEIGDDCYGS